MYDDRSDFSNATSLESMLMVFLLIRYSPSGIYRLSEQDDIRKTIAQNSVMRILFANV